MARRFTYYANLAPSYDADAQAFFTAASITDSGQKTAINTLVLGLKSASIWSKIPCIYPFVGGNATAHSYNLKNPATFQLTFFGGWTHSATGATPNGTNAYATTNFKPQTNYALVTSRGYGFYTNTNNITATYSMGVYQSANNAYYGMNHSGSFALTGDISASASYTATNSVGHSLTQKFSNTDNKSYRNGVQVGSSVVTNNRDTNFQYYLGAMNGDNTAQIFAPHNLQTAHIHDDLNVTDIGNLYTLLLNYNTTLSR